MKLYQRLTAAAAALVMLTMTTACNKDPVVSRMNKQVTLNFSWWGNDARNRYTIEAIDKFQELHPEIRVECSYSEWSGFETRNKVQMISDTEADVMQINFGWLTTYSSDGTGYYDINELTENFQIDNFSDTELAYGMMSGHLNAIPIAMNTETVYINKTIYDQYHLDIPRTWDDLFNAAKVMQPDGSPLALNSASILAAVSSFCFEPIMRVSPLPKRPLQFAAHSIERGVGSAGHIDKPLQGDSLVFGELQQPEQLAQEGRAAVDVVAAGALVDVETALAQALYIII